MQPNISFRGEYKCLRFLTPDVTIEWEEKRNLKVAQKRALERVSIRELDSDITGESARLDT